MEAHNKVIQILLNLDLGELETTLTHFPELIEFLPETEGITGIKNNAHTRTLELFDLQDKKVFQSYIDIFYSQKNYETLDPSDSSEWAFQLWLRKATFDYFERAEQNTTEKPNKTTHRLFRLFATRNLYLLLTDPTLNSADYEDEFFSFIPHLNRPSTSVSELTVSSTFACAERHFVNGDFETIRHFLRNAQYPDMFTEPREFDEFMAKKIAANELGDIPVDQNITSQEGEPYSYPHHVHPEINLKFSDKQIMEDFKTYLTNMRAETGIKPATLKQISTSNIQSLMDQKVLQYMDLCLLNKYLYIDDSFNQTYISELLFTEPTYKIKGTNLSEKFRKNTLRHAEKAMSKDFIASLLVQSGCYVYPY